MTATSNRASSFRVVGGFVPSGGQGLCYLVAGHVLDVRFSGGQSLDSHDVDVEADDVEACLDRPHGNGEPRVALTHDHQAIRLWRTH